MLASVPILEWFDPFLSSPVMQRALLASLLAGVACGLIGTWIVLRGLTFIGDALAHGVVPGLAASAVLGINPVLGAVLSAAVMVGGITIVQRRARFGSDTAIGLLFVGMLSVGVLIMSRSTSFAGDLTGFLFGGITGIRTGDLLLGAGVAVTVLVATVIGFRAFLVLSFNADAAKVMGLRPGLTHAVMLILVTATIVASFKSVGSLLVFALITAPAAAAVQVVRRVPLVLVASVVFAEMSVVIGLLLAWHANLAPGASMASTAVVIFLIVLVGSEVTARFRRRAAVDDLEADGDDQVVGGIAGSGVAQGDLAEPSLP